MIGMREALTQATYVYIDQAPGEAPMRVVAFDDSQCEEESDDACLYVEVDNEEAEDYGESYAFHWFELTGADQVEILTLVPLQFTR